MSSRWLPRLVVLCGAIGCAPHRTPPERGVLAVAEEQSASFTRNFNPLLYTGDVRWPTRHAMYEPLLIYNPLSGAYVPWLAEAYEWSEDRTRLRLAIRKGVRWSDGAPFSARDVAFTFQLLARHPALDVHALWQHLADVRAPDDATLQIAMKRPHVPLLEAIAQQPIVPEHVWAGIADPMAFTNDDPVATGPFTRVTTFKAQVYEVARNPHHWQPVAVSALRFRAHPSNEQVILALLNDELDWAAEFVPAIDRIWRSRDPAHHHYWFPLLDATLFLYPNTARPPLADARVRKALSLAIDRALLVKVAVHGYTRPADATGLSDAHARYRDAEAAAAGDWVAHDPGRAARLLDEAGFPAARDGRRALSFTIQVPAGYSDWVAAAQIISRGLRRIGVEAPVRTSDVSTWFDRLGRGDYTLALGWSELSASPYGFYRSLMSGKTVRPLGETAPENWHRFGLPAADELLTALEATSDAAEERRLVSGLERLFAAHAPAIPLYPAPSWGEFNSTRFTGFPDAEHPYAPLSPGLEPQTLLVLTGIAPR